MSGTEEMSSSKDKEFFRQDFTSATEWDVFNARLEEIIYDWKLKDLKINGYDLEKNELSLCKWEKQNEFVKYSDLEVSITRYHAIVNVNGDNGDNSQEGNVSFANSKNTCQTFEDLMTLSNNWCILEDTDSETIHPLARWYGLRDFVVVSVTNRVLTELEHRMLLSSIYTEIAETGTEIPFFMQAQKPHLHVYSGNFYL